MKDFTQAGSEIGEGFYSPQKMLAVLFCLILSILAVASAEGEILDLSLEELMKIEVTGLSKKEETFSQLPAAAFVLTQSDIKASTATTLPELLKIVPGISVADLGSGRYAVASRGFNAVFSNKLLVLIDGKEAYSNLFSSVHWDALDIPFDDLERIEVYRGPAGSIYGSNAVNGIINIVTKKAADSSGAYFSSKVGNVERAGVDLRYGGKISESFDYRLSGKFRNRDRYNTFGDDSTSDTGFEGYHAALRVDGEIDENTKLSSNARLSATRLGDVFIFPDPSTPAGVRPEDQMDDQYNFYIAQEISHLVNKNITANGMFSYDREHRESLDSKTILNTFFVEGRTSWKASDYLDLTGGATYRYVATDLNDGNILNVTFSDKDTSFSVAGLFAQAEYQVTERVKLYAGARGEYNEYTDFEYQPNLRLAYYPNSRHTFWASVGRSTRLPSIVDENTTASRFADDVDPVTGLPVLIDFREPENSEAETLMAYELGYRGTLTDAITVDMSAFFYDYSDIQAIGVTGAPSVLPGSQPVLSVPAGFQYSAEGEIWGGEVSTRYSFNNDYYFTLNFSHLNVELSGLGDIASAFNAEGVDPENKVAGHLHAGLTQDLDLDLFYYFVDVLPTFTGVDAYHQFDARASYQLSESIRLSFIGRNLTESEHLEWGNDGVINVIGGQVPRSYYGMIEFELG